VGKLTRVAWALEQNGKKWRIADIKLSSHAQLS